MKLFVKKLIRSLGYEVRRYAPTSSDSAQLTTILKFHGVNLVFDVGANTGGFGRYLRQVGFKGDIVSFEPMAAAYAELLSATATDRHWTAATRAAIGAYDGEVEIHVAGNSESSSILEMLESHSEAAPTSTFIGKEVVPIRRLDGVAELHIHEVSKVLLKIDTQGYEEQVLAGGQETVARALVIQMELSLVPLYAGQKLMQEMMTQMEGLGFSLWGVTPVFAHPQSGRMLQMDGIFCRSN